MPAAGHPDVESGRHDPRPRLAYQPALDGLRGAAVLAVMCYHGGVGWARGGFLGVDAFFVLSGYLITSLLLAERDRSGRVDLGRFWSRRARRLLPAVFAVVVAVVVTTRLVPGYGNPMGLRGDAFSTLAYVQNWHLILSGQSYFARFAGPSALQHAWSLAIEEQWYLVWPLLLALLASLARGRTGRLVPIVGALAVASAAWMAFLFVPGTDPSRVYYGTDTRAQSLLVGAVLALLVHAYATRRGSFVLERGTAARRWLGVAAAVALAGTALAWSRAGDHDTLLYRGGFLMAAAAVAVVIAAAVQPDSLTRRALGNEPLRRIGLISYGLYVWHWPVFLLLDGARTGLSGTPLLAVRFAASFAVALASYFLLEQPIRRGAFSAPRSFAFAPAAGVAAVLVVSLGTATLRPPTAFLTPRLSERTSAPVPPTSASAPPPARILVEGDSVALTLGIGMSAVDASFDTVVDNQAILGCDLLPGAAWINGAWQATDATCEDWPVRWARAVAIDRPDVAVVLFGTWDLWDRQVGGRRLVPGTPAWNTYARAQLAQAVQVLSAQGARVVLLTAHYYDEPNRAYYSSATIDRSMYVHARVDTWNQLIVSVAQRDPRAVVIDLASFVNADPALLDDGVHFGPAGSRAAARWLVPRLLAARGILGGP